MFLHKPRVILILLTTVFIGLAVGGVYLLYRWNRPLGPELELSTHSLVSDLSGSANSPALSSASTPEGSLPISSQVMTSTETTGGSVAIAGASSSASARQPQCGGPPVMTILGVGSDNRDTGYLYGLADSIYVIRIDFSAPNIMVINFPRDLWVEIPGISDHYGITHGKINQAYLFGNPGMGYYDGPGGGPGLLARTLDDNFSLVVDHYIAIDRQTFVSMINTIGGVDIELDSPIDLNWPGSNPNPELVMTTGNNHLDGELALSLATNRIPNTFQRMDYQKVILIAAREKLLQPANLPKLPILVSQFITSVQTDLSPADLKSLMCISQAVSLDSIKDDSFPQDMFTATNTYDEYRKAYTFTYQADFVKLRAMIAEFMNGVWPMP